MSDTIICNEICSYLDYCIFVLKLYFNVRNKKTYLYLKALTLADTTQRKSLEQYFSTNDTSQLKVDSVKMIFLNLNIPELTTNLIKEYHASAMENLAAINSENKEPLLAFSELLMYRVS